MMKRTFFLLFLLFTYFLCQSQQDLEFPNLKLRYYSEEWSDISRSNQRAIIVDAKPSFAYEFERSGREYLVAIFSETPHVIATYVNFANTWKHIHQSFIEDEGYKLQNYNFFKSGDSVYVTFENLIPGGSSGNASCYFTLYDVFDNSLHVLKYDGYLVSPESDQLRYGEFDLEDLPKSKVILQILEKVASESKTITRD